jgi:hypothetical protein
MRRGDARQGPAYDSARDDRMRCRSALSATVCAGSGASPRAQAMAISSAPSRPAKFNFDPRTFRELTAQVAHRPPFHGMWLRPGFGGHAGRPVEPPSATAAR